MVTGEYIISGALLGIIGLFLILKRLDYHIILIPPLLLVLYYFVLLVIVPLIVRSFDRLENNITAPGAILIILLIFIGIAWLILKIPIIRIPKLDDISISTGFAKGLAALLLVFILEPIVILITSEDFSTIANVASDPNVQSAIWISMSMALLATLASVLLGVPLGYLLARREFMGRSFIQGLVDVPIVMPHPVAGIALLSVFGISGIIGAPLNELGVKFVDAWPGIVIAMMFVSAPFVINSSRDGFAAVDPRLENVGRSLGANRLQVFSKVALKISYKSIITGALMAWARAISEFGAILILVYFPMVASVLIYDRYTSFGLAGSRPIAILLILISLLVFVIMRFIVETTSKQTRRSNRYL
jgi:molybdate/tungstate transport system permease protein